MKEIELKVLEINDKEVMKKLLSLGAKKEGTKLIIDHFFDFPDKRIKKTKEACRLRKIGDRTELTYKGKKEIRGSFKIAEETEIKVSDFQTTKKILNLLGLEIVRYQEKKRASFLFENVRCEIDTYPTIPTYLEIEGQEKYTKSLLQQLGIPLQKTTNKTANEVLQWYKQNPDYQKF